MWAEINDGIEKYKKLLIGVIVFCVGLLIVWFIAERVMFLDEQTFKPVITYTQTDKGVIPEYDRKPVLNPLALLFLGIIAIVVAALESSPDGAGYIMSLDETLMKISPKERMKNGIPPLQDLLRHHAEEYMYEGDRRGFVVLKTDKPDGKPLVLYLNRDSNYIRNAKSPILGVYRGENLSPGYHFDVLRKMVRKMPMSITEAVHYIATTYNVSERDLMDKVEELRKHETKKTEERNDEEE